MTRIHVLTVPGADSDRDAIVAQLQQEADVCLHTDPERRGVMWNWLGAVTCAAAHDGDLRWSVIVQDDAKPFANTWEHLTQAQWYSPSPILSLTYFGGYGVKALTKGAPYALGHNLTWGGAMTYRRDAIEGLAGWAPRVVKLTGFPHDDELAAVYAHKLGTMPALVSRAIFDQPVKPSLLGHTGGGERRPEATIEMAGPGYGALPRYVTVSSSLYPRMRELIKMRGDGSVEDLERAQWLRDNGKYRAVELADLTL